MYVINKINRYFFEALEPLILHYVPSLCFHHFLLNKIITTTVPKLSSSTKKKKQSGFSVLKRTLYQYLSISVEEKVLLDIPW